MALGIVLTPYGKIPGSLPWGVTQSWGGDGTFLEPYDAQYNTHGEVGYYPDTQLGAPRVGLLAKLRTKLGLGRIPTDFQLATTYGYLPFFKGWVHTNQGYYTPPWQPPNGYHPELAPPVAPLAGLRDATVPPAFVPNGASAAAAAALTSTPLTTDDVIAQMNAHNDRVFALTLVSTTAVAVSALITMFRTFRLIRNES